MNLSRSLPILLAGVILAGTVAAVAVLAGDLPARPEPSGPSPSAPIGTPSPAPSDDPGDFVPIRVDIDVDTHHDVYVDIFDRSGGVVRARSGPAGEGASVDLDSVVVENLDARTLRLSWVDYPIDNALALYIDEVPVGGLRLLLVRPEPTGATDTVVSDRVLILEFEDEVSADEVVAFVQDGLDV